MVGCGLIVAVVLWLWRQFGGCGGDYWVVVVVIFWVVVDFCFLYLRCRWWMWVCAGGGCRYCCGSGCWWPLLR